MTGWISRLWKVGESVPTPPDDPDPRTLAVLAISLAFIGYRTWLATQSGFGFHQGWNEGHYALIAHGFLDHPLVPRYGSTYVYSVPPMFPYIVAAFFTLFGESTAVARLPSIFAAGSTVIATYALGWIVYRDRTVAAIGAGLLVLLPYVQLYGGRAQTDMLMTFLFTAALAAIVYGYEGGGVHWLLVGGGLFAAGVATKQPVLLLPVIVLVWLLVHRRTDYQTFRRTAVLVLASAVALGPLVLWLYLNFQLAPAAFMADWERELFGRTLPFANVPLLLVVGLGLGVTPLVVGLACYRLVSVFAQHRGMDELRAAGHPNVLLLWVVIYGAFILYRTPRGHQYYLIAIAPPLALLAARGFWLLRSTFEESWLPTAIAILVVANALVGTVVLLELSGEYSLSNDGGDSLAPEVSHWMEGDVSENATILVFTEYRPSMQWYLRDSLPPDRFSSYQILSFDRAAIDRVRRDVEGPVYVVYPAPTWVSTPFENDDPDFETSAYDLTLMNLVDGPMIADSKFVFYLSDRRLEVYRVD